MGADACILQDEELLGGLIDLGLEVEWRGGKRREVARGRRIKGCHSDIGSRENLRPCAALRLGVFGDPSNHVSSNLNRICIRSFPIPEHVLEDEILPVVATEVDQRGGDDGQRCGRKNRFRVKFKNGHAAVITANGKLIRGVAVEIAVQRGENRLINQVILSEDELIRTRRSILLENRRRAQGGGFQADG